MTNIVSYDVLTGIEIIIGLVTLCLNTTNTSLIFYRKNIHIKG